jgi:hypothetical protein
LPAIGFFGLFLSAVIVPLSFAFLPPDQNDSLICIKIGIQEFKSVKNVDWKIFRRTAMTPKPGTDPFFWR